MNKIHTLALGMMVALSAQTAAYADTSCDLHIMVVAPTEGDSNAATDRIVVDRLKRALTADGITGDENYGQLYLTGRFVDSYKDAVPGPPAQVVVKTDFTVYVADIFGNKVFDSETFQLTGVGTSEQRAYINALSALNAKNGQLQNFVKRAQRKTINYFDKNYRQLLSRASKAASMGDYEQALYYSSLIPECSTGYPEAESMTLSFYQGKIDREATALLDQAKAAFATEPNAAGAAKAYAYLAAIDPNSSVYPASRAFADEVKKQTKAEYDFEVHDKYNDQISIRKRSIDAAKEIGVAWGRGQKAQTTNILWH